MSEAALRPDKDFSKEVDQQLPAAEKLAKVSSYFPSSLRQNHIQKLTYAMQSNLQGAIEKLSALEKQTRQVSDPK